jgi:putative flippase GtrA
LVTVSQEIRSLQRRALESWPRHRDKAAYLLIGGWNTFFWYACFFLLYYLLHEHLAPSAILALAYAIASTNGYLAFRFFVFAPVRHPVVEYLRYQAIYLPILAANMVALPLALTYTSLSAYIAQPMIGVFTIFAAYIGNKYFAFRKRPAD